VDDVQCPPEWQAAMHALLLVAEHDGPTMFARIGVMRALNRHVERVFNSDRKDQHWGRRKLARDRSQRPESIAAASILTARAQTEADHFGNRLKDVHLHRCAWRRGAITPA
jgi:hypothetical protein